MEPIPPLNNPNIVQINTGNSKGIPKLGIERPSVISTIDPPVLQRVEAPVTRGLALPVFDNPDPSIKYPVINVPTQEEFDAAVNAEQKKQEDPPEKTRGLPDKTPNPQLPQVAQTPPTQSPIAEIPASNPQPTLTVFGTDINLPDPSLIATAGSVAVVTTAATMVATTVFNTLKTATEPIIREATKNKFKIKIKQIKPVLHYIMAEEGHIDIFEYSSNGTRLVAQTDNVEQYIRDQVDTNALYEIDNKIIIDDIMAEKFTKEGRERFKSLFAPPQKIAKKLSARLSF